MNDLGDGYEVTLGPTTDHLLLVEKEVVFHRLDPVAAVHCIGAQLFFSILFLQAFIEFELERFYVFNDAMVAEEAKASFQFLDHQVLVEIGGIQSVFYLF